jgi:SPP1 gp7 family putative phage head morphogenesis protein
VAINRKTLKLLRELRVTVGREADESTRILTAAWVRAWDELRGQFVSGLDEALALAILLQRWPRPWELARLDRLARAITAADLALRTLGQRTEVVVTDAAGRVIHATGEAEPRLIASQLPAAEQTAAAATFSQKILPSVLDVIAARTAGQITASAYPLSMDATEAMKRALIRGVVIGENPRDTARQMLKTVEGTFNGGLNRAVVIARTEVLDAYRAASRYSHAANADVLEGWRWQASLDRRCCPSCWGKHGTLYGPGDPGPLDHHQGRCSRMPEVKSWKSLGINLPEPPSIFPDARARFDDLTDAEQLSIMGPGRLRLLKSGAVDFPDLAVARPTGGWRTSYGPRPVTDLQRLADRRTAQP